VSAVATTPGVVGRTPGVATAGGVPGGASGDGVAGEGAPGNGFGTCAVFPPLVPLVAQAAPAVDAITISRTACRNIVTPL
jgi:hypothetical protein